MPRSLPGTRPAAPADGPRERSPAPDRRESCDTEKPGPAPRACCQERRQDADRRREARPRLFSAVFPGPFSARFRPRRPRGRIPSRPRPGKVKKRAARASKRRENRPGPDPQNGTRKHIFIYTHFKPGFSNVNPGNVNILPKQKYLKYRTGGGKYERIQRKIRARDAGTVDGEKARSAMARPRDRSRRIVYMYLCIRIRELYTGIHCIQVSRYAMPRPPAL